MEEIYMNVDPVKTVCQIPVTKNEGSGRSKKRLYVGVIISLGILNVFLLIGLISLGVFSHDVGSLAADLTDTKDKLTDRLQVSNDRLSDMTEERDRLNATLTEMSNEMSRLQSLLKKKKTCPAGWRMFSCSCYLLSASSGSWDEGRADCRTRGGDLVVINNDDEQKFVLTVSEKSPWIGLKEETEGSWKWVDGTPLSSELKKYWGQGQPDNAFGGEACAQIWENYKTWNDNKCDDSFLWICEKAPE
ncbi:CD209 antigen-like protein E isoform X2 [Poecilia latipinna]|uniref:CD209 antigen-like protein E isoform X2 n=1 Tax=Poecilia latipinna TaxID=48699 RepID=UPI00072E9523|nr:PREDICTED: CD209 antigen-like protein E isoform X2 [Poecilia latipinna]